MRCISNTWHITGLSPLLHNSFSGFSLDKCFNIKSQFERKTQKYWKMENGVYFHIKNKDLQAWFLLLWYWDHVKMVTKLYYRNRVLKIVMECLKWKRYLYILMRNVQHCTYAEILKEKIMYMHVERNVLNFKHVRF